MNCPKCNLEQSDRNLECARCGLIFSKYIPREHRKAPEAEKRSLASRVVDYLLFTKDEVSTVYFGGRAILFVFLLIWSMKFLHYSIESNYVGRSFMHLVNLPFHEAGHVVFLWAGSVMHSLGGTLGQIIMPLVCLLVFLIKSRDTFGASVALWWTGESILDIAPYINDARSLSLQLLGGNTGATAPYGFHDWNFILTELGLLRHDHLIADIAGGTGKCLIVLSLIWSLILLTRQYKEIKKG
ncbi:MAG: zinc ribbon domain-containing protein [Candidatus Sabulitectum sp.]|nr:zinc ribbon domain-containing protein [Candidatus Sabulitectum sp.]